MRRWEIFLWVVAPSLLSSLFVFVPLENFVSAYPVPWVFTWYIPWRGAVAALTLWLVTGLTYSDKRYWLKLAFLGSAVAFLGYHYMTLLAVSARVRVVVLPLFYLVGEPSPLYLDLGQVVAIVTAAAFRRELAGLVGRPGARVSGGTSPRTA